MNFEANKGKILLIISLKIIEFLLNESRLFSKLSVFIKKSKLEIYGLSS